HICLCYCFFFSSRRRHTRFSRDWSSDVCSSDLAMTNILIVSSALAQEARLITGKVFDAQTNESLPGINVRVKATSSGVFTNESRSEERRVGKECRSLWSAYHQHNKTMSIRNVAK